MTNLSKKQTAGNNKLLAYVKRQFNTPIFKKTSDTINAQGLDAAIEYLLTFSREENKARDRHEYTTIAATGVLGGVS